MVGRTDDCGSEIDLPSGDIVDENNDEKISTVADVDCAVVIP